MEDPIPNAGVMGRAGMLGLIAFIACGDDVSLKRPEGLCTTDLAPDEPPCQSGLADGPWGMSHRGAYAQASSARPAPAAGSDVDVEHTTVNGIPIVLAFSEPYEDGTRALWGTLLGLENAIAKLDDGDLSLIDEYVPSQREEDPPDIPLGVSGAYTFVDARQRFVVARARFVAFYQDAEPGERSSDIALAARVSLPDDWFCGDGDYIAGALPMYDGSLAVVTEQGGLAVVPMTDEGLDLKAAATTAIDPDTCGDADAEPELVSNNLAADEEGGLYPVTSRAMYRFDWDGKSLKRRWRSEYASAPMPSPIRLGPGSGSTPSLMGTDPEGDRFVVITDGQPLMHLVFYWRDAIPEDWEPVAPGRDRRVACEVPIRFGLDTDTSSSEQSVLIRGHGAVVVNNLLTHPTLSSAPLAAVQNLVSALEGAQADKAPRGMQRVDWDPETRRCQTVWENPDVSVPNGIPTLSVASGLVYGIGRQDASWGLVGLDFDTGAQKLWAPSPTRCDDIDMAGFGPLIDLPEVATALGADPQFCENSLYAATEVGPAGAIYTGTLAGVTRYVPADVAQLSADAQRQGALEQIERRVRGALVDKAGGFDPDEHLGRAALQLDALREGPGAGDSGVDLDGLERALADAQHAQGEKRDAALARALEQLRPE